MSCMKHVSAATDSLEVLSLTTASSTFVRTSATLLQPLPQICPISGTLFPHAAAQPSDPPQDLFAEYSCLLRSYEEDVLLT